MAFTDPQTITISGVTSSLPNTSVNGSTKKYTSSDGLIELEASHAYGRRTRRVIRLNHTKVSADLYLPETNVKHGMSVYTVFDLPPVGYTNAEALAIWVGFNTQLEATTNELVTKLLGGES
jgi:hypothetical protein